jgi:diguanylate cyclase (GGDEF)-like protein/PAS domain S-box-containing protein
MTDSPLVGVDDRFRVIFDSVNDGIFISNPTTGRFIEVNQPGYRMFGYDKAELIGCDIGLLSSGIHPFTIEMAIEQLRKASLGNPQIFEWQCKTKDGVLFWSEISIRFAELGHTPAVVAIVRDITERKRQHAQIAYMAHHDALTGLANRSMFATAIDRAIAQSICTGKKFAILFLDLDSFKDVNDRLGHPIGDRLLRLVAARLQAGVRTNEDVARFGGDEFAILVSDFQEPEEIAALANRLIVSIGRPFSIDGNAVHVGASIGVSIYEKDASDAETLMCCADIALYCAKAEGRQTYRFHSDAMNEDVRARVTLTDELRLAIPTGQLFIAYQPMVRAKSGRIVGVEALIRWRHPRLGILLPHRFLLVAVSSGLIVSIDQWVLREACRQGRQWIDAGIATGTICVNLSTAQFKEPLELEKHVFAVLAETRLPPHLLELEITESTLIGLSPQHGEMIQRLRRAGVRFSLDDFGTGYSSLNYLRRFSVDRIKIAQEFISDLATNTKAADIVKLILNLSRNFGNDAVAEGVETPEQLRLLQDLNCPNLQGFYLAPPMSAEAIVPLLSAGTLNPSSPSAAFAA